MFFTTVTSDQPFCMQDHAHTFIHTPMPKCKCKAHIPYLLFVTTTVLIPVLVLESGKVYENAKFIIFITWMFASGEQFSDEEPAICSILPLSSLFCSFTANTFSFSQFSYCPHLSFPPQPTEVKDQDKDMNKRREQVKMSRKWRQNNSALQ